MLSKLESKPLRVNQQAVDELGHLVRHGNGSLEDLYESTLLENAQKIEPLHFITKRKCISSISLQHVADPARNPFSDPSAEQAVRSCIHQLVSPLKSITEYKKSSRDKSGISRLCRYTGELSQYKLAKSGISFG